MSERDDPEDDLRRAADFAEHEGADVVPGLVFAVGTLLGQCAQLGVPEEVLLDGVRSVYRMTVTLSASDVAGKLRAAAVALAASRGEPS